MKSIKIIFLVSGLALLCACGSKTSTKQSDTVMSMQIIDRNGFTETISNKDRLSSFETTDFLTPQPFQKVLRVYSKASSGQTMSKITSYHDNGQLWQYLEAVDGRAHGIYREWFSNGQQKVEATLIEGVADIHDLAQSTWVFHGHCKVWDDEGSLMAEFDYEKGLLHQTARYFFPGGNLEKMIPYTQGEIDGTVQVFDENGFMVEEIPYVKGEKHGKAVAFWKPEQLLSKEVFDQGRLVEASYFDISGASSAEVKNGHGKQAQFQEERLNALYSVENGLIEGEVQLFNATGGLHCSYFLKDGKKHGEEWEYYFSAKGEDLKPKLCVHWNEDKIQGQVKTWYPNGKMESQREINNNKKQGIAFSWYKNGDMMLVEEYESELLIKGSYFKPGDKHPVSKIESGKGTATLYTSDGFFLKKIPYEKGRPQQNHADLR